MLDPALLRPGRFDRRVVVNRPDVKGRFDILKVHTRHIRPSRDLDLEVIARGTPGFAGADLENLVNEAALLAARADKDFVEMADFEAAKDDLRRVSTEDGLHGNERHVTTDSGGHGQCSQASLASAAWRDTLSTI